MRSAEAPIDVPNGADSHCAGFVAKPSVSRRTMLRSGAFASSVVASMPTVLPLTRPHCARRSSIQVKTASWVSIEIDQATRAGNRRMIGPSSRRDRALSEFFNGATVHALNLHSVEWSTNRRAISPQNHNYAAVFPSGHPGILKWL